MPQIFFICLWVYTGALKNHPIEQRFSDYFAGGTEAFLPHVSVNCVLLTYRHPELMVLVHRIPGQESWGLPGGFVRKEESLDESAYRNLGIAGLGRVFLRQIRTFGDPLRVSGIERPKVPVSEAYERILNWITQRFITVVYYGLIRAEEAGSGGKEVIIDYRWLDVNALEPLAMDHGAIIGETRKILSTELLNHPVLSNLLPERFTLNELRGVFEAILNRPIDRGTFRRKILKLGIVEQVDTRKDPIGRPSHLFRFNQAAYNRFLAEETRFGF